MQIANYSIIRVVLINRTPSRHLCETLSHTAGETYRRFVHK